MAVDEQHLKRLYSSLDDDELVKMARGDLVPEARELIEKELACRRRDEAGFQSIARAESSAAKGNCDGPKVFLSGRTEPPFSLPALYSRAFFGEEALWRVFFIGVLPPLFILGALKPLAATSMPLAFVFSVAVIGFSFWAVVSMWNSARNVTAGYGLAGVLARLWAVLQAIGGVSALVGLLR